MLNLFLKISAVGGGAWRDRKEAVDCFVGKSWRFVYKSWDNNDANLTVFVWVNTGRYFWVRGVWISNRAFRMRFYRGQVALSR